MEFRPLRIEGAVEVTPRQYSDPRGVLAEGFRADRLAEQIGHEFKVRQTNISVSSAGAVRGIHYASLPPSQAKYVTALAGVFLDFIIDIRVGSPTFGQWDVVRLDTVDRKAVYLSEGLGHALACLEDGTAMYLCSEVYNPAAEKGVTPLDPTVALDLPAGFVPIVSDKDAAAPTLEEARAAGLLPDFAQCVDFRRSLRG
ncbi:MAG: dTDP-4-dehydrorhamnose 3,5-epimerase family protein [Actinomycetales bacterium]|nr:dTDP-4-dehydrorhamnose 3,5-epimerase family protein [Candidatus Phosphoribacter baldrii]